MKSIGSLIMACACAVALSACAAEHSHGTVAHEASLTVMNWNLQTFFDATFDGNEYSAFKNEKSGWSRAKYDARLSRLAEVITALDVDVLVFEELEKEAQLYDITNRLSGSFDRAKRYGYACFATDEGSSIGCAVLSRFPLGEITVHSLDIRTEPGKQPHMRPLLQVPVLCDGKKLIVFVNHWKSKSGDTDGKTAAWRAYQERVLTRCMQEALSQGGAVLACGDFNSDIGEFARYDGGALPYPANILLRGDRNLPVYSPWYDAQRQLHEPGSYYYKDTWERIDHFFVAGNATLSDFAARTDGVWATDNGIPAAYRVYNGTGYSDHLPITCRVSF